MARWLSLERVPCLAVSPQRPKQVVQQAELGIHIVDGAVEGAAEAAVGAVAVGTAVGTVVGAAVGTAVGAAVVVGAVDPYNNQSHWSAKTDGGDPRSTSTFGKALGCGQENTRDQIVPIRQSSWGERLERRTAEMS